MRNDQNMAFLNVIDFKSFTDTVSHRSSPSRISEKMNVKTIAVAVTLIAANGEQLFATRFKCLIRCPLGHELDFP